MDVRRINCKSYSDPPSSCFILTWWRGFDKLEYTYSLWQKHHQDSVVGFIFHVRIASFLFLIETLFLDWSHKKKKQKLRFPIKIHANITEIVKENFLYQFRLKSRVVGLRMTLESTHMLIFICMYIHHASLFSEHIKSKCSSNRKFGAKHDQKKFLPK